MEAVNQVQIESGIVGNGMKPTVEGITGTAEEVADMLRIIAKELHGQPVLVEINLSCPNILGKPPISLRL